MISETKNIKHFLFSQHLADGIRVTIEIILPSIIFTQFGKLEMGIACSLGALCVSISDAPGPVKHKRNGMLYCNVFIFLMALFTGLFAANIILLGLLIICSTFFFSMFSIYGNRAASIGTAALLVMILKLTKITDPYHSIIESLLIAGGGILYMLIAMFFYRLTPYRPAQRSLGECIHETAKYLRIKSELYNPQKDHDKEYSELIAQQILVNESQERVRELLFKNRELLKESTYNGRLLVLTFVNLVDLYEQIMSTWYDYNLLREKFSSSGILEEISATIQKLADELDDIGFAILSNTKYKKNYNLLNDLNKLKIEIDKESTGNNNSLILKKVLVNLRNIGADIDKLGNYSQVNFTNHKTNDGQDYSGFVSHQKIDGTIFKNNCTLSSTVFRHSLRMMITFAAGFIVSKLLPNGQHSYWILLTILVILKPGFSLTKQRNFQRFTGTVVGGAIGIVLLAFIHDRTLLFGMIIFFMIGTYTFQRLNYITMVIFLTPYILMLFYFLGLPIITVAEERLLDTGIGSILSLLASYLLFPNWEIDQLNNYMKNVLRANINYLSKIADFLIKKDNPTLDYKLIRKEVFVSTANLSSSFNRMLSEPGNKQRNGKDIYEFVVLNNVLSSNIASLVSGITANDPSNNLHAVLHFVKRSIYSLEDGLAELEKQPVNRHNEINHIESNKEGIIENNQLNEQLAFVYDLTKKIKKVTKAVVI